MTATDSLFYQHQIQQLDSVILYQKNESSLLQKVLSKNNGNPKYYDRIRHLAFKEKNSAAIEALAIYQNKEDIEEFKTLKEFSFGAIAKFPDTAFWEFLLSFKEKNQTKNYLLALSVYKTEESGKVLQSIFFKIEEENIISLAEAVSRNYCEHYQDIILFIWQKHKIIDTKTTSQIIKDIPEKAAISFTTGLLSNKTMRLVVFDINDGSTAKIIPLMLDNIKTYQPKNLSIVCEKNIETEKFFILEQFLTCVRENNLTSTQDEILNRLQQKNQPYEVYALTETILSFNISENKEKIIAILKSKQIEWDLGLWSEKFRALFQQYDISFD